MNWIRDNILKVVVILVVLIVLIVVVVACSSLNGGGEIDLSEGYLSYEDELQNAAINYMSDNKKLLPAEIDDSKRINYNTLVSDGYIKDLYALEDGSTSCKGYVDVIKIGKKNYRYTPFISCGKYYTTNTIADYIINTETKDGKFVRKEGDGLYSEVTTKEVETTTDEETDDKKETVTSTDYYFRGEYPNNYLVIEDRLFRIISITSDSNLKIISIDQTEDDYVWDDRYNIQEDDEVGINDFVKSRLYNELEFIYDNQNEDDGEIFFTSSEKDLIAKHDFCIGKVGSANSDINDDLVCSEKTSMRVGLINVVEYAKASLSSDCTGIFEKSCANYNYFTSLNGNLYGNDYVTLTANADNTYEFYDISNYGTTSTYAEYDGPLFPVVYLRSDALYASGSGTLKDPYVVR